MWFKNLAIYRCTEPFTLSAAELEEKLQQMRFRPCGSHDPSSFGWTAPLGRSSEQLIHAANGFFMLCAKKQEKVLPTAVINEMLGEHIQKEEQQQSRKLSNKEKTEIKEDIIFQLLPRAFTFSKHTFAYIDAKGGWIVIDAASANKAEELLSHLRQCLGSLAVVPVTTKQKPVTAMTRWLLVNQPPADITIEDECELRGPEQEGAIIRCKRHDLTLPEIKNHLDNGKQVIKLALSWTDRLSFVVDENLTIKRLRFLELIQEQAAEVDTEDETEQFDVEFSIMTRELAGFLMRLLEIFGGENRD